MQHPARVIAMSVPGSGAIAPREAFEWVVRGPYVRSILFGAFSHANVAITVSLIREFDAARPPSPSPDRAGSRQVAPGERDAG